MPKTVASLVRLVDSMGGYSRYQIGSKKGRLKDHKSLENEYRRILQCKRTQNRASTAPHTRSRPVASNAPLPRISRALARLS